MTNITTGPLVDELIKAINTRKSAIQGLQFMIGEGKLGALAKEMAELAETVSDSGYVPPAKRVEHDKLMKSADRTNDRELAKYYRDRARKIRAQIGETK